MRKMKKLSKGILAGMLCALCVWIGISFFEVNAGNAGHSPHYSKYNLFVVASGYPDTM